MFLAQAHPISASIHVGSVSPTNVSIVVFLTDFQKVWSFAMGSCYSSNIDNKNNNDLCQGCEYTLHQTILEFFNNTVY